MSMKKLLIGAVAATILFSTLSASHAQSTFADVPDNHWAAQAVKRLKDAGIMVGRPVPVSIRQKPVRPVSPSENVATTVESALQIEPTLSDARIRVRSSKSGGDKTLYLDGKVRNEMQEKVAESIARSCAPGWTIVSRLAVLPAKKS